MDFAEFINFVIARMVNPVIVLILSLAVVYFLWSIAEVIRKSDQPEELAKLKTKVLWGVIALAVMISLWGLVRILTNTFRLDSNIPQLNTHINSYSGNPASSNFVGPPAP